MVQFCRAFFTAFVFVTAITVTTGTSFAANNEAVAKIIREFFDNQKAQTFSESMARNIATVSAFYQSRNFKPVWTRDTGPKGKGKSLFEELNRSMIHGLSPDFYNVSAMAPLMTETSAEALARLDMLLSGAFIDYAHDLRNGRLANIADYKNHKVAPIRFEASDLISDAADAGNLRNLASEFLGTDDRYVRLIAKYVEFGRIAKSGLWPEIDADGEPIKIGQKDDRMNDIRTLLLLGGDLPQSVSKGGPIHDSNTFQAVKAYQARHGLERTGEVDAPTLQAMATPLTARMKQILVNLERRRWQNRELGENHVYVNLADERARIVLNGETAGFAGLFFGEEKQELPTFFATATGVQKSDQGLALVVSPNTPADTGILSIPFDAGAAGEVQKMLEGNLDPPDENGGQAFKKPLDVYVTYLTAWANKDGSINFRPDELQRDGDVADLLGLQ